MQESRFSEEKTTSVLKQEADVKVSESVRKHGTSHTGKF